MSPHPKAWFLSPIAIAIPQDTVNTIAKNNACAIPTLEMATNKTNIIKDKHTHPKTLAKIFQCLY